MIVVSSPLASPRGLIQAMLAWVTDRVRVPIILDLKKCFHNVGHCFTLNTMLKTTRTGQIRLVSECAAVLTKSTLKPGYHHCRGLIKLLS